MLKNFIKLFLSIWIILIVISFAVKTLADEHLNGPVYDYLEPTPVPLYCGETAKVFATTTIDFRMKMLGYSEVRNEGRKDGKLLANISIWYNPERDNGVVFMTFEEYDIGTCILGYGVDWKFDIEILLDYVNENME